MKQQISGLARGKLKGRLSSRKATHLPWDRLNRKQRQSASIALVVEALVAPPAPSLGLRGRQMVGLLLSAKRARQRPINSKDR